MRTYPYTFDNGAGESLTFARRIPTPGGDRLEGDNLVAPGAGPPMHVHYHQEEGLTVVRGRIGFQRPGGPEQFAGPGETVVFRAGEAHRFWNAGEEDLHCTAYIEPAGNIEFFLGALFDSQKRNGGHRPDPFEAAFLAHRYRTEYAMLEIPALVQRLVFPVVVALGTALGKYARYADAPEPMGS
jgi:quercetin dioxygenase-like cupin family protein